MAEERTEKQWTYEEALQHSAMARMMHDAGHSDREIVAALAQQVQRHVLEIVALKDLVPKRCRFPNGRIMIWRCPEEYIPLEDFSDSLKEFEADG